MKSVYEYTDYRAYLLDRLGAQGTRTGMRLRACEAIGCHSTYLSQVLAGKIQISLEHAEALSAFFELTEDEAQYFVLLVLVERAGTKALKQRFEKQLKAILRERSLIKKRIKSEADLSEEDKTRFYSHWIYGAIHALVSIPEFQTLETLAKKLGVHSTKLKDDLEFMLETGLVKMVSGRYTVGPKSLHLPADSNHINKHHTNWRFHTIQNLHLAEAGDLHYSAAISLSEEAVNEIRELLLKNLEKSVSIIEKSKEEVGYVLNFDFYRLT